MIIRNNAGLKYFQFESLLNENIIQAVFSRRGGVSPPPWNSLNLGSTVGDDPENVEANKLRLLDSIGYSPKQIAQVHQVHSALVRKADKPQGNATKPERGDAIITNKPGLLMVMRFADCVPIFIYDPVKHAAAIVHAGWKGTIKSVAFEAVRRMVKQYGSKPKELIAGIGPSIGPDHYQIGEGVISEVMRTFPDQSNQILIIDNDSVKLDLWKANELTLSRAGVNNIEIAGICTACELEDWYSHRGEKGKTGRFGAVLGLR